MALLEDVLGIVLIVFFLIAASLFVSTKLFSDQAQLVATEQNEYLYDYYSTSVNAFIHARENNTGLPMHILLGDYINLGTEIVSYHGATINISERSEEILDEFFRHGYYMELTQLLTNTTISFVLDGAPSKETERRRIQQNLEEINERITNLFQQEGDATLNTEVFILKDPGDDLCTSEGFKDLVDHNHITNCTNVGYADLYGIQDIVEEPNTAHWAGSPFIMDLKKRNHFESDWLAGVAFAEQIFRQNNPFDFEENFHIIIIVSDQLSGTSYDERCFTDTALLDYYSCILCYNGTGCPVGKAYTYFDDVVDFLNESDSTTISIFSFQESFPIDKSWMQCPAFHHPAFNSPCVDYTDPNVDPQDTKCDYNQCTMCNSSTSADWDADNKKLVYFAEPCEADALQQMEHLASNTSGRTLSIDDIGDLPKQLEDSIRQSLFERRIEFGQRHPERTRYVFERKIFLLNREISVYLEVYDTSS